MTAAEAQPQQPPPAQLAARAPARLAPQQAERAAPSTSVQLDSPPPLAIASPDAEAHPAVSAESSAWHPFFAAVPCCNANDVRGVLACIGGTDPCGVPAPGLGPIE